MRLLIGLVAIAMVQLVSTKETPTAEEIRKAICREREKPLTMRSQFLNIYKELELDPDIVCAPAVKFAIDDFHPIMANETIDVCSMKMAQDLNEYFLKYLNTSPKLRKHGMAFSISSYVPITKSLRDFVVAFGMQVSNICNSRMFKDLTRPGKEELFNDDDIALLGPVAEENGVVSKILDRLNDPGQIILPSDIAAVMSTSDDPTNTEHKFYLKTKFAKDIRQVKDVCAKRFQPVYEPLILPNTILASAGFSYKDPKLTAEFNSPVSGKRIQRVSMVVTICEMMKLAEVFELNDVDDDHSAKDDNEMDSIKVDDNSIDKEHTSSDKKNWHSFLTWNKKDTPPVKIILLSKEEAEALMRESDGDLFEHSDNSLDNLLYKPKEVQLQKLDDVYLYEEPNLMKAVKKVRFDRGLARIAKAKMHGKAWKMMKLNLKAMNFKLILTGPIKAVWRSLFTKLKAEDDSNDQVMAMVDKMIAKVSAGAKDTESIEYTDHMIMRAMTVGLSVFCLSMTLLMIVQLILVKIGMLAAG